MSGCIRCWYSSNTRRSVCAGSAKPQLSAVARYRSPPSKPWRRSSMTDGNATRRTAATWFS
jgi:hypothetical protein